LKKTDFMPSTSRTRLEKRLVAGIAASMVAALGCSVAVIEHDPASAAAGEESRPFWSTDASTSNLSVVELYRSNDATWERTP
jgi:hypothetical protein